VLFDKGVLWVVGGGCLLSCTGIDDSDSLHFVPTNTAVAQCLRCCATNRKVAGSIPGGVTGILH